MSETGMSWLNGSKLVFDYLSRVIRLGNPLITEAWYNYVNWLKAPSTKRATFTSCL